MSLPDGQYWLPDLLEQIIHRTVAELQAILEAGLPPGSFEAVMRTAAKDVMWELNMQALMTEETPEWLEGPPSERIKR